MAIVQMVIRSVPCDTNNVSEFQGKVWCAWWSKFHWWMH